MTGENVKPFILIEKIYFLKNMIRTSYHDDDDDDYLYDNPLVWLYLWSSII